MIAEAISKKLGMEITRRQIDIQPVRSLGEHKTHVRLTVDLIPEVLVIVHREGEVPSLAMKAVSQEMEEAETVGEIVETELEAAEHVETDSAPE